MKRFISAIVTCSVFLSSCGNHAKERESAKAEITLSSFEGNVRIYVDNKLKFDENLIYSESDPTAFNKSKILYINNGDKIIVRHKNFRSESQFDADKNYIHVGLFQDGIHIDKYKSDPGLE